MLLVGCNEEERRGKSWWRRWMSEVKKGWHGLYQKIVKSSEREASRGGLLKVLEAVNLGRLRQLDKKDTISNRGAFSKVVQATENNMPSASTQNWCPVLQHLHLGSLRTKHRRI